MPAGEVVTMHHPKSGQTQRASRAAYDGTWAAEGWKVVSSEQWEPEVAEKPVEKMKVDELKAYAEEHQIDLGEATSKADILAVIVAHNEKLAAESGDGSPAGD